MRDIPRPDPSFQRPSTLLDLFQSLKQKSALNEMPAAKNLEAQEKVQDGKPVEELLEELAVEDVQDADDDAEDVGGDPNAGRFERFNCII